jgi:hypothetical protein
MTIHIAFDAKQGLLVQTHIRPAVLRALLTAIAGLAALPWLGPIGHALGWL